MQPHGTASGILPAILKSVELVFKDDCRKRFSSHGRHINALNELKWFPLMTRCTNERSDGDVDDEDVTMRRLSNPFIFSTCLPYTLSRQGFEIHTHSIVILTFIWNSLFEHVHSVIATNAVSSVGLKTYYFNIHFNV